MQNCMYFSLLTALTACTSLESLDQTVKKPPKDKKTTTSIKTASQPSTQTFSSTAYKKAREALNYCKQEDDCTQVWPGACPHGPYFINAKADVSQVFAMERKLQASSNIHCEPPIQLQPAGCQNGKCVAGARSSVKTKNKMQSCWDTPIAYIANDGGANGQLYNNSRTSSNLLIYQVPAAGKLQLKVTWPRNCTDCELQISEHNSGMASLIQGKRTRQGHIESIELSVAPGPYYFRGMSASSETFLLQAQHRDNTGASPMAGAHGEGILRFCEK